MLLETDDCQAAFDLFSEYFFFLLLLFLANVLCLLQFYLPLSNGRMVNGYSAGQSDLLNAPSGGFEKSQVNTVIVFAICKSWLGISRRSCRWNAYAVNAFDVSQLVYTETMIHFIILQYIASVLRVQLQISLLICFILFCP